jgi:hypothetical protein
MATKSRAVANPRQIRHREHPYSDAEIMECLNAVVAFSGNIQSAVAYLKEHGELEKIPRPHTISGWIRGKHAELYADIREKATDAIERDLADRYRGVAAQAIDATEVGVDVARRHLESGKDRDPARSAANLALVATKTLRDYALLEGKPTNIQETRGLPETLRTLISMGVLVPQATAEIEDADVEPEVEAEAEPEDA